jgi:hypothetical protein
MANLERLFKDAQTKCPGTTLRRTKTQEVLDLTRFQGVAWRPLSGRETIQIYPPTKGSKARPDGDYFVLRKKAKEWRYYDPERKLNDKQWSYVGCQDCNSLPDEVVFGWLKQAYKQLKRYKGAWTEARG